MVVVNSENEMEHIHYMGDMHLLFNVKVRVIVTYHYFSKGLKTVFIEQQYVHFMYVNFECGI
jgi:hypothetical protein